MVPAYESGKTNTKCLLKACIQISDTIDSKILDMLTIVLVVCKPKYKLHRMSESISISSKGSFNNQIYEPNDGLDFMMGETKPIYFFLFNSFLC